MAHLAPAWWSTLPSIVLIDRVLAGDNVIVIAAPSLPPAARELQTRAIVWEPSARSPSVR